MDSPTADTHAGEWYVHMKFMCILEVATVVSTVAFLKTVAALEMSVLFSVLSLYKYTNTGTSTLLPSSTFV